MLIFIAKLLNFLIAPRNAGCNNVVWLKWLLQSTLIWLKIGLTCCGCCHLASACATVGFIIQYINLKIIWRWPVLWAAFSCVTTDIVTKPQAATSLRSVPAWRWWYVGPVVVGNVGGNSVSNYRLHASKTQQLSYVRWPTPHPSVIGLCVDFLSGRRQPMTGRLLTHRATQRLKYRSW